MLLIFIFFMSMKILSWNCRGAGNDDFRSTFTELFRVHKPDLVILIETKVPFSSTGNFFINLGFNNSCIVDPVGRVGGIWVLWDSTNVTVNVITASNQVVHASVTKANYDTWILSATYASPNSDYRDLMWENFAHVASSSDAPWMAVGDFNDFSSTSERRSNARDTGGSNQRRANKFNDNLDRCGLMDLGSCGPRMTWTNGRFGLANTLVRLDRALANANWRQLFPEATVRVLPRTYSDHHHLLVLTDGMIPPPPILNRNFIMQDMWLFHPNFEEVVISS